MKKMIIIFLMSVFSSFAFANIILQQNISGLAWVDYTNKNCFTEPEYTRDDFFTILTEISGSMLYEFNSKKIDNKVHFQTGVDLGFNAIGGLTLSATGGLSIYLCKVGNRQLEINPNLTLGALYDVFGGVNFYERIACDFDFIKPDRKGFFWGVGINNFNCSNFLYFVGDGLCSYGCNFLGVKLSAGYRF